MCSDGDGPDANEIKSKMTAYVWAISGYEQEQLDAAIAFIEGRDILPTGFGKSLCYACLPA